MKLIDGDALLELYADRLEKLEERYGVHSGECGVLAGAMKLLEIQPTIEPERTHGHWIHKGCGCFECDQCGELVSTNVYIVAKASDRFKFCSSCGSDMREGEKGVVD